MITVEVVLVFTRRWGMPSKHEDILNAYVKADPQKDMEIYFGIPQGMDIPDSVLTNLKFDGNKDLVL